MRAPEALPACDYLVIESTYGDRVHPKMDPDAELAAALQDVLKRDGVAVIPTFAVGRAQALLVCLARLQRRGLLQNVPVYVDSPMATDASYIYNAYQHEHRLSTEECKEVTALARFVATPEESRQLDTRTGPLILLSASGMATGGRVVHHLKAFVSDPRNLVLLGGFQAGGTRGAQLAAGAPHIRIHGQEIPVRAEVRQLQSFSGHADADQLIAWARSAKSSPRCVYVTHGEPNASDVLRRRLETELQWHAVVPEYKETVEWGGT
jgi:metallo-beta-lactamase family protein